MSAISIKEIIGKYLSAKNDNKTWPHDRSNTVGGSEIGQCERKVGFSKLGVPGDPDFVQRLGAAERGNIIENHLVVPALYGHLPEGVLIHRAGTDQETIVDGYLSATPDAILTGVEYNCLAWLGVEDTGADCIALEVKSIDPRVDLKAAKLEHEFQTQVQMGLLRACTPYKPDYALICYIDASFVDDVTEFAVKFDPKIYAAAQARARRIMNSLPAALHPEGKMGGNECRWCMYASHCADVTVSGIPADVPATLGEDETLELRSLAELERRFDEKINELSLRQAETKQNIKDFLTEHKIRRYHGDGWSVAWSSTKGRELVDLDALEKAGIVDLDPFRKTGNPSDRLTVKVK